MIDRRAGQGGKDLQDLQGLARSPLHSFLRLAARPDAPRLKAPGLPPVRYPALDAFASTRVLRWALEYLRFRFGPRHAYQDYTATPGDTGVYAMDDGPVRIALASDWATGTDEAARVAALIVAFDPHYSIHLGDVYYVGDPAEVAENFLGQQAGANDYTPVRWPGATRGSFSLLGNHEMYAGGVAYFDTMLPRLGIGSGDTPQKQRASFFCLENQHWRIIGLDTGYNSVGKLIIEYFEKPDCALPGPLVDWLRDTVKPAADDPRGIILLSHHQPFSAFDTWYPAASVQLAAFFDRPLLWFWGHEHRLAVYPAFAVPGGVTAYGRCIGHGGMPVDVSTTAQLKPHDPACPVPLVDPRRYHSDEHLKVGVNGFVRLTLAADRLDAEYADVDGKVVYAEAWSSAGGALRQLAVQNGMLVPPPAPLAADALEAAGRGQQLP